VRITPLPPIRPRDLPPARASEKAGYAPPPAAGDGAAPVRPVQPPTSVGMLVAIAAADDAAERRRRAVERGKDALDMLERLDRAPDEADAAALLAELARRPPGGGVPDDPELARLLAEIELRVMVEMAKRTARA
jgi:hypothetical protein